LSLYRLAGATVRELKDVPPTTPRALIRSALLGSPLPMGLLYQAVRRNRAEQQVTRPRAALIKLVLLSQYRDTQEQMMVELDPNHADPAYQCGRLLAVLAEIQRNAIGKAALVDRFYGTASSAPAAVFGRLLRGAQPHLSKLERDKPTVARALQRRLEEITAHLRQFPRTLSLEQQGLFALGFYHQRAHDRAQMLAAVEQKNARTAADTAADTMNTQE
jgi:CRISPR-associated protein Csd1